VRKALLLAAPIAAMGVVVAAPAGIAAADASAQNTINNWEQQGYQVNVDRVGSGPIDDCVVTSVRNPNTITRSVRVGGHNGAPSYLVPVIVSRTVQVSLDCTG
jgi:hypothetical protein